MKNIIVCLIAFLIATPAAGIEFEIRFALPYPLDTTVGKAAQALQKLIDEHSNSTAAVRTAAVELANVEDIQEILDGLEDGSYHMAAIPSNIRINDFTAGFQLFKLPLLFSNIMEVQEIQSSDVGAALL